MATTANSTGYGPRRALIFSGEESDAARDDGPKALEVLRQHYQGKGKPQVITTLKKTENESIVDYVIRAEAAATYAIKKRGRSCKRRVTHSDGTEEANKQLQNILGDRCTTRRENDVYRV